MDIKDPNLKTEKDYMKDISLKTIHPKIFYRRCEKCGMEYRKIPIHRCEARSLHFTFISTYYGCSNCFHDKQEFRNWLENTNHILSHEDFKQMRKLERRLKEEPETVTIKEVKDVWTKHWC